MKFPLVVFVFIEMATTLDVDYCQVPCQENNKTVEHVMCTLKHDCNVGPECRVKTEFDYGDSLKRFTLDMHNYYRSKIALGEAAGGHKDNLPRASDMSEMVWDEELARFAQCHANKCILQYDKCRRSHDGVDNGQIIFIRVSVNQKSTEEMITEMIESIFNSSIFVPEAKIKSYRSNKQTKHFAQLAWAKSRRVGCGMTNLLEDLLAFFMVCNYGPAGTVEGERVYRPGPVCSRCPKTRRCGMNYFGLCAANQDGIKSSSEQIDVPKTFEELGITLNEDKLSTEDNPETSSGTNLETTSSEVEISNFSRKEKTQLFEKNSTNKKVADFYFENSNFEDASEDGSNSHKPENIRRCVLKRKFEWLGRKEKKGDARKNGNCASNFLNIYIILFFLSIVRYKFIE